MCVLTQIIGTLIKRRVETHKHTERRQSCEDKCGNTGCSVKDAWQLKKPQVEKMASSLEPSEGRDPIMREHNLAALSHQVCCN